MAETLRVLQAIAGRKQGGAEAFFERLVGALRRVGVDQRVAIRRDDARSARLRRAGIEPIELAFGGAFDFVTPFRLRSAIRDYRPSVILTWMNRASAAMPSRRLAGDRAVRVGRLGGYYDLKYYRGCDHLVGNTRDIVDYVQRQGWPAERAHYLPNFVTAEKAPAVDRATLQTPADAVVVLALGRFHPNKAFAVLLDAMARVPRATLWLAGEGELRPQLEAQIARLDLASRVRLLGWRDDVPALLAASDVLVCPSRHEPLGNVVIEGWAQDRPVIVAASAGPAALVEDGRTGMIVPVDDAASLAQAIEALVADPARRASLAAAGRTAYEAAFTESAVVRRYLDFFRAVTA